MWEKKNKLRIINKKKNALKIVHEKVQGKNTDTIWNQEIFVQKSIHANETAAYDQKINKTY